MPLIVLDDLSSQYCKTKKEKKRHLCEVGHLWVNCNPLQNNKDDFKRNLVVPK